jgi:hypothetical protein
VTRFKVNPSHVQPRDALSPVWASIEKARQRALAATADTGSSGGGEEAEAEAALAAPTSYFTAYASGKSAVRLPRRPQACEASDEVSDEAGDEAGDEPGDEPGDGEPGAAPPARPSEQHNSLLPVPFDVHKFLVPNGIGGWRAPRTLTCTEALDHSDAPCVLHYPSCGFDHWLRKYELLGGFGDHWWGRVPCRIPAHLQSRDVVQSQSRQLREQYYRWRIEGNELGEHAVLAAHGLLTRVTFVRNVVRAAAAAAR